MILRIDVIEREEKLYPQYYQDKYFAPNPNGRFVKWEDITQTVKELDDVINHVENKGYNSAIILLKAMKKDLMKGLK